MIGSLAKQLMQKAVAFAGDATKSVSFTILNSTTYNPETGEITYDKSVSVVNRALIGRVTEADSKKYALTDTTHKIIVAMADYEAAGSPVPQAEDELTVNGKLYAIEKVVLGSMEHSVIFFVCER